MKQSRNYFPMDAKDDVLALVWLIHSDVLTKQVEDAFSGSGANGQAASVTVTFGELRTNGERTE